MKKVMMSSHALPHQLNGTHNCCFCDHIRTRALLGQNLQLPTTSRKFPTKHTTSDRFHTTTDLETESLNWTAVRYRPRNLGNEI